MNLSKAIPLILLLILVGLFFYFDFGRFFSIEILQLYRQELLEIVNQNTILAPVVFAVVYSVIVALSIPVGSYMTLLIGFLFGPYIGIPTVLVGATVGASLLFLAARGVFHDALKGRTGSWRDKMADGFKSNTVSYLLFLRLAPIFPFFVVNVIPAFFNVRLVTFILTTFFGILPGTSVLVLLGQGLGTVIDEGGNIMSLTMEHPEIFVGLSLLAILSVLPILIKKLRKTK